MKKRWKVIPIPKRFFQTLKHEEYFRSIMLNVFDKEKDEQKIGMLDIRTAVQQELIKTGVYVIHRKY